MNTTGSWAVWRAPFVETSRGSVHTSSGDAKCYWTMFDGRSMAPGKPVTSPRGPVARNCPKDFSRPSLVARDDGRAPFNVFRRRVRTLHVLRSSHGGTLSVPRRDAPPRRPRCGSGARFDVGGSPLRLLSHRRAGNDPDRPGCHARMGRADRRAPSSAPRRTGPAGERSASVRVRSILGLPAFSWMRRGSGAPCVGPALP
jgi:hypothetical protein